MLNHNIAVKAFLINEKQELLCLKSSPNNAQNPGEWDIPGGRLDPGESPFDGLYRECTEEVGLDVIIKAPLKIHHFTRQDGQGITMIVFLCTVKDAQQEIILSEEHTEYVWQKVTEARAVLHESYHQDIDAFETFFTDNKNI